MLLVAQKFQLFPYWYSSRSSKVYAKESVSEQKYDNNHFYTQQCNFVTFAMNMIINTKFAAELQPLPCKTKVIPSLTLDKEVL